MQTNFENKVMRKFFIACVVVFMGVMLSACTSTTDRYINQLEEACLEENRDKIHELNAKLELIVAEGEISEEQLNRYSAVVMTYYDLFE